MTDLERKGDDLGREKVNLGEGDLHNVGEVTFRM